jgi:hypothetical protein
MEKETRLPVFSTCSLCRSYLSDRCDACLKDNHKTSFQPRVNLALEDLPPFPRMDFEDGMPVKMRQVVVALYMEKIMERLQGVR